MPRRIGWHYVQHVRIRLVVGRRQLCTVRAAEQCISSFGHRCGVWHFVHLLVFAKGHIDREAKLEFRKQCPLTRDHNFIYHVLGMLKDFGGSLGPADPCNSRFSCNSLCEFILLITHMPVRHQSPRRLHIRDVGPSLTSIHVCRTRETRNIR